jgi:hypothetical protein
LNLWRGAAAGGSMPDEDPKLKIVELSQADMDELHVLALAA